MADGPGLVHEYEKARAGLSPSVPESEHRRVLRDAPDVPDQIPSFRIGLTEVGISDKTAWITLPQGRLPFRAEIYVDLRARARGIHMSRIEETLSSLYEKSWPDLQSFARELAFQTLEKQHAGKARVLLEGKVPSVRRAAVTRKTSVDAVEIGVEVVASAKKQKADAACMLGLSLCHITACPCTQLYNGTLAGRRDNAFPLPTHSQRAVTKLRIEDIAGDVCHGDLYECLESALHLTQDLLKRPDEAEIVLKAHRFPQFAEDAVRETAREVGKRFGGKLPGKTAVVVESVSLESIHVHDVRCVLRTTLDEIVGILSGPDGPE